MPGHLFVVQSDLTKLGCDAVLLPCDGRLDIMPTWQPFLPPDLPEVVPGRLRMPRDWLHDDLIEVATQQFPAIFAAPTTRSDEDSGQVVVDRLIRAITALRGRIHTHRGRSLPLLALPLFGTGQGGLRHRRGEVLAALLPALAEAALDFDIALVVHDERDYAAAQAIRSASGWEELGPELTQTADRLGRAAGHNQLSLFIGAGVSRPVGVPDWQGLLAALGTAAGVPVEPGIPAEEQASPIVTALGEGFHEKVREIVDVPVHALGHSLLANLRLQQMVTTNYDRCLEMALEVIHGPDGYRVLTRHLGDASKPWLLKLHGDVAQTDSIVLSREQYEHHQDQSAATRGVVQSLMLTSHLLFVGFSMADQAFLRLAEEVALVRRRSGSDREPAGTALSLGANDIDREPLSDSLDFLSMSPSGGASAARTLEVFLDRLAWTAAREHSLSARYFLDSRYAEAVRPQDRELKAAMLRVGEVAASLDSEIGAVVRRRLTEFGYYWGAID